MRVEDNDRDLAVAEHAELVGLFHKTKLPLGEGDLAIPLVADARDRDLFPPHIELFVGLCEKTQVQMELTYGKECRCRHRRHRRRIYLPCQPLSIWLSCTALSLLSFPLSLSSAYVTSELTEQGLFARGLFRKGRPCSRKFPRLQLFLSLYLDPLLSSKLLPLLSRKAPP